MKYLITFLFPALLFAQSNSIVVKDTIYECSDRAPENIFEDMRDLSNLNQFDNIPRGEKNRMTLLGVTLLDMIQSKQRLSQVEKPGSLSNVDLLLVLRPLPKKINLPKKYFPRFIIQCSTFQKSEVYTIECNQINPENAYGINRFEMALAIRKHPGNKSSCPTQVTIKYNAEIDKNDFKQIKDKSFELMGARGFTRIIGNLFANPKLFFKTYWEGFYQHWINASTSF